MSDTKHTPEPWEIESFRQYIIVISKNPLRYAIVNGPEAVENARRIVACVNACAGMADPDKEIAALRAAAEKARDIAEDVYNWSEAYPIDIFNEPTPEQVDNVCKTLGFRLDAISAMVLRAFTKQWGARAKSALAEIEEVLK